MKTGKFIKLLLATAMCAVTAAGTVGAQASVVIGGTRIVYNAKERETSVRMSNEGDKPALKQVWIDRGDPKTRPANADAPFTATPPVARIEPHKGQTTRLFFTGEALPQDKETVFWLNVVEVPPAPDPATDPNTLQLAIRSSIKLFYRPAGLPGAPEQAPARLTWRLRAGTQPSIEVTNPTPYYVSFSTLELASGAKSAKLDDGVMVAPGETRRLGLKGDIDADAPATVKYHAISDYGGMIEGEAAVTAK